MDHFTDRSLEILNLVLMYSPVKPINPGVDMRKLLEQEIPMKDRRAIIKCNHFCDKAHYFVIFQRSSDQLSYRRRAEWLHQQHVPDLLWRVSTLLFPGDMSAFEGAMKHAIREASELQAGSGSGEGLTTDRQQVTSFELEASSFFSTGTKIGPGLGYSPIDAKRSQLRHLSEQLEELRHNKAFFVVHDAQRKLQTEKGLFVATKEFRRLKPTMEEFLRSHRKALSYPQTRIARLNSWQIRALPLLGPEYEAEGEAEHSPPYGDNSYATEQWVQLAQHSPEMTDFVLEQLKVLIKAVQLDIDNVPSECALIFSKTKWIEGMRHLLTKILASFDKARTAASLPAFTPYKTLHGSVVTE